MSRQLARGTTSPTPSRRTRVLVVDDDTLQLRALERTTRDAPIDLTIADNAIDAMLHVGTMKPDLIVMDVFMPGLDGLEACRRIRANVETKDVRVVLASATMTADLEAAALIAGATRAVAKPIDLAALIQPPAPPVVEVEPARPSIRGADLIVSMLADAGVDVVFGIPGGAIAPVYDAFIDREMRVVTTRHENGAMFAAAGYAQSTGKLGVVAVTSGPGALNALTGLASAWCDGLPVLLLVGEASRPAQGRGVLQDGSAHGLQIVEMARYVTKLAAEVPRPSALPHMLRRAIATALSGKRGPVLLTLPFDVTTADVTPPRASGTVTLGSVLDTPVVAEVAELLRGATRPMILVGSGARGDHAPQLLRTVAEKLRCPVGTTPKGKGIFSEGHPLSLGVVGLGGHRSARAYLESGVDVVLAIGTSLSEIGTDGFSSHLQGSKALIHVDIDSRQMGKSYSPTHAITATASEFLGTLAQLVADEDTVRPALRALPGPIERHLLKSSAKPNRVASQDALREIQRLLPRDTIYTIDSGEHFIFATHYLEITRPDSFIAMTGLGSMGQSIGAAIGAQLAHPDRTVAAICGDGCFAMNAFEIATAVQAGLPLRIFVFNDERLGMVEHGHKAIYGRSPDFSTGPLDICAVARGLGATTVRIDRINQLRVVRDVLQHTHGPVIAEVAIDHEIVLPKNGRVAALAKATPAVPALVQAVNRPMIPGVVN